MKKCYLGVRVELPSRILIPNLIRKYNRNHASTKLFNLNENGRITTGKDGVILLARGATNEQNKSSGFSNFSAMIELELAQEVKRIAEIINVLGNDRLIREKANVFVANKSLLNSLTELKELTNIFNSLNKMMPGFFGCAWYYAPEIIC